MTYQTEFPDIALPSDIPADWVDMSWHNDACPSFVVTGNVYGTCVTLWIDDADPDKRENGADMNRFSIHRNGSSDEYGYTGDDWEEAKRAAIAERLAMALRSHLGDELSATAWQDMRRANVGVEAGICESHSYCDANMPMAAAFHAVMGRPILPADDSGMTDDDGALWNQAWRIATPAWLTAATDDDRRFDAWRLTGEPCNDLGAALNDDDLAGVRGYLYQPGYIEAHGLSWHVVAGNEGYLGASLFDAESWLWDMYANTESEALAIPRAPTPATPATDGPKHESDRAALELTVEGLTAIVGALAALPIGALPSTPEGVAVVAAYHVAREALGIGD